MIQAIRAEFRKLLTVRTTYFITGIVMLLVILVAFILEGFRLKGGDLLDPMQLSSDITGAMNITVFGAIVAILLVTHEYRYSTIMYTLTATNNRAKVLFAKLLTVSVYAIFLTVIIAVLSPIMSILGVHAAGHMLAPQTLHIGSLAWRTIFYGWGYAMAGFIFAVISRSQVGAIVTLFVVPTIVEQLLSFTLLKHNSVYLPFNALSQVVNGSASGVTSSNFSAGHAAGIYVVYLAVGLAVSCALFLRRDAN